MKNKEENKITQIKNYVICIHSLLINCFENNSNRIEINSNSEEEKKENNLLNSVISDNIENINKPVNDVFSFAHNKIPVDDKINKEKPLFETIDPHDSILIHVRTKLETDEIKSTENSKIFIGQQEHSSFNNQFQKHKAICSFYYKSYKNLEGILQLLDEIVAIFSNEKENNNSNDILVKIESRINYLENCMYRMNDNDKNKTEHFISIRDISNHSRLIYKTSPSDSTTKEIFKEMNIFDYIIDQLVLLNKANGNSINLDDYNDYITSKNDVSNNNNKQMIHYEFISKVNKIDYIIYLCEEFLRTLKEDDDEEIREENNISNSKLDKIRDLLRQSVIHINDNEKNTQNSIIINNDGYSSKMSEILKWLKILMNSILIKIDSNKNISSNDHLVNDNINYCEKHIYNLKGNKYVSRNNEFLLKLMFILSSLYQEEKNI
jgi:hypothetical protein